MFEESVVAPFFISQCYNLKELKPYLIRVQLFFTFQNLSQNIQNTAVFLAFFMNEQIYKTTH